MMEQRHSARLAFTPGHGYADVSRRSLAEAEPLTLFFGEEGMDQRSGAASPHRGVHHRLSRRFAIA